MIRVSDGSSLTVVAYIAAGGQGEVYRVLRRPDNTEMALKWYTNDTILRNTQFRQTLQYNCNHNAPSQSFLWPLAITETINGSYGYVMKLRPEGFIDLGKFFCIDENPQAYFRSTLAKLTASLQICDAFSRLHQSGFSYQDINDGSFLIDPLKGHVRICDNDNIVFDGLSNGIAGKPHYMAPGGGQRQNTQHGLRPIQPCHYTLQAVYGRSSIRRMPHIDRAPQLPYTTRRATAFRQRCRILPRPQRQPQPSGQRPSRQFHTFLEIPYPDASTRIQGSIEPQCNHKSAPENQGFVVERDDAYRTSQPGHMPCQPHRPCARFSVRRPHANDLPAMQRALGTVGKAHIRRRPAVVQTHRIEATLSRRSFAVEGICRKVTEYGSKYLALENISPTSWIIASPTGHRACVSPGSRCQLINGMTLIIGNYRATVILNA